jgi:hypothetical protein
MRWVRQIGLILVCLVLVACGNSEGEQAPDATVEVAASPTLPAVEMTVGSIVWSASTDEETGEPAEVMEGFTPESPTIIASIEVTDVPADTEFTATWTLNDQPIAAEAMQVTAESDMDHAWVSFRFVLKDGQQYPTGQLGVVITTSTGTLREGSIRIDWP